MVGPARGCDNRSRPQGPQPPDAGKLYFEHAPFRPFENPEQRLVLYSAVDKANTPEKLAKLLAEND